MNGCAKSIKVGLNGLQGLMVGVGKVNLELLPPTIKPMQTIKRTYA